MLRHWGSSTLAIKGRRLFALRGKLGLYANALGMLRGL